MIDLRVSLNLSLIECSLIKKALQNIRDDKEQNQALRKETEVLIKKIDYQVTEGNR